MTFFRLQKIMLMRPLLISAHRTLKITV